MKTVKGIGLLFIFFLGLIGCESDPQLPKPRTYPRLDFPEKSYILYEHSLCGYGFEVPTYAQVERDSIFFGEKAPNDCWINVFYDGFNGQLYCSYYPVRDKEHLDQLIQDGYKIASKHTVRADYIDESVIDRDPSLQGMLFEIEGPAASGVQFFVTDNSKHFFKASLYINDRIIPDSIGPIIQFLKPDIFHMIETFQWKDSGL
jgi:gliding motility-associated lipoprotein GldD